MKNIETKINQLPPDSIGELDHFLDYLISRKAVPSSKKLRQDWAGGLKDIEMTALELQKNALDWRLK